MKSIQFNDKATGEEISIAYSDYGKGKPIVLLHGWPLSREMWEYQLGDMVNSGHRVVKYDRRGFGKSSKPWNGYDYDTLTDDLNEVMVRLDLKNATLIGFSMGGGEVVRYIRKYGHERVAGVVLISSIAPFLLKTADNDKGVPVEVFDEMIAGIKDDRIGFLEEFGKKFFGHGFLKHPVSTPLMNYYLSLASKAPARSTIECVKSFSATDFRKDVEAINVPTLIIHGDSDKIVPIEVSSNLTAAMLPHADFIIYEGAPHGLFFTHKERLNADILNFMMGKKLTQSTSEQSPVPMSTSV